MRRIFTISLLIAITILTACFSLLVSGAGRSASAAAAASTKSMYVTFYGWPDNSPPGNAIAYPHSDYPKAKHNSAGGSGTYSNPITFASDTSELPVGTIVYVPYVQRYFIMEDDCAECDSDWSNSHSYHIDLWVNGKGAPSSDVINCEDDLTQNGDVSVIVNPASNLTVSSIPLFNSSNDQCYQPGSGGGVTPTPTPTPVSSPYVPSGNGQQANVTVYLTWYGYNDNSGATENQHGSADIAYPQNAGYPTLHNLATEGKGTYTDPITFAARPDDQVAFPIGSVIYVPFTHKYYIMEDECGDNDPQGCLHGTHHVDLWMGPQSASNSTDLENCEDNNTPGNSVQVVINPSPSLTVDTTPEFTNNQCTLDTY